MPFPMKIQPVDFYEPPAKTSAKLRFKRLLERQFTSSMLKTSPTALSEKVHTGDFEPSSVCLAKMVQNFIEGTSSERQLSSAARCGRCRSNCFSGGGFSDSEEDDCEPLASNSIDGYEKLKSLVLCSSVLEWNLLADIERIVEKNSKICKRKDETCRKMVTDGLIALGYDASVCKSRWEKSPSCPAAGDYEYIDVIIEGQRMIIDIDFRSQFEIARPTKSYRTIIQSLPSIFVGKSERLQKIVCVVSAAAKQSLGKRGMPVPPWRKAQYVTSKWLSPHARDSVPSRGCSDPAGADGSGESLTRLALAVVGNAEENAKKVAMRRHVVGIGFGKKVTAGLALVMDDMP